MIMCKNLIEAIRNKNIIAFKYKGGLRIVEPYSICQTASKNICLKAYQIAGVSDSGILNYKLFEVDNITNLYILEELKFDIRKDYVQNESSIDKIYI